MAGCVSIALLAEPAVAGHQPRYPEYWDDLPFETVPFYQDLDLPPTWDDTLNNAVNEWNLVTESGHEVVRFVNLGVAETPSVVNPCAAPGKGGVRREQLDSIAGSDFAGVVITCNFSGGPANRIASFMLALDIGAGGFSWNEDNGTPASDELDMRSVYTHEFGHATGWGGDETGDHYSDNGGACPESTNRKTMCQSTILGTTYSRTLESVEKDVFRAAYPH